MFISSTVYSSIRLQSIDKNPEYPWLRIIANVVPILNRRDPDGNAIYLGPQTTDWRCRRIQWTRCEGLSVFSNIVIIYYNLSISHRAIVHLNNNERSTGQEKVCLVQRAHLIKIAHLILKTSTAWILSAFLP